MKLERKLASHCLESLCDEGMIAKYDDNDVSELACVIKETLDDDNSIQDTERRRIVDKLRVELERVTRAQLRSWTAYGDAQKETLSRIARLS